MSKMKHQAWQSKEVQELIQCLAELQGKEELKSFLTDLLTEGELLELSKRWQAARLLHTGTPYTEIVDKTGLSSTTVARISKWLKYGAGGYLIALKRRVKKHG